jgi:hypothetical protein
VTAKRRQLLEKHRAKRAARHAAVQEPAEEHKTLAECPEHDASPPNASAALQRL